MLPLVVLDQAWINPKHQSNIHLSNTVRLSYTFFYFYCTAIVAADTTHTLNFNFINFEILFFSDSFYPEPLSAANNCL